MMFLIISILSLKGHNAQMVPKIIGGDYANIIKFPHSIHLFMETAKTVGICGASVLNQNILLSAAHCFEDYDREKWEITALAGDEHLEKVTIRRDITRYLYHERYDVTTISNDIGLAYLKGPLPLGDRIKRVIIMPQVNAQYAEVAGWGNEHEFDPEPKSNMLKSVRQKIWSRKYCKRIKKLGVGTFCAGSVAQKKALGRPDTGDSGSALVTDDNIQIGIVSFRDNNYRHLVIYTNVSYYYQWIKHNSRRLYCKL